MRLTNPNIAPFVLAACMLLAVPASSSEEEMKNMKIIKRDEELRLTNEQLLLVNTALAEFNKRGHDDVKKYELIFYQTEYGYAAVFRDFTLSPTVMGGGGLEVHMNENFEVIRWNFSR